uniref:Uncharacterized protein n=1 Tax=Anguilla anguilla TaxID=7936 RepID=A0A0E9WU84_ANGAN
MTSQTLPLIKNEGEQEISPATPEVKQEEQEQVDTFFSTMSHRYEEPPP